MIFIPQSLPGWATLGLKCKINTLIFEKIDIILFLMRMLSARISSLHVCSACLKGPFQFLTFFTSAEHSHKELGGPKWTHKYLQKIYFNHLEILWCKNHENPSDKKISLLGAFEEDCQHFFKRLTSDPASGSPSAASSSSSSSCLCLVSW
jgi:hypothetical protein